jgi:hypothetical protein
VVIEIVKDVMVPQGIIKDCNNVNWLQFQYHEDGKQPWKWPKVLRCDGKLYKWMSYNSDNFTVNYRQCEEKELAWVVKKK